MALMQLTIVPLGTQSISLSSYVAAIHRYLKTENVRYTLTDMATIIEGETPHLLRLAAKLHEIPFAEGAHRVMTQLSIDDRRDKEVALGDKIQAVENKL